MPCRSTVAHAQCAVSTRFGQKWSCPGRGGPLAAARRLGSMLKMECTFAHFPLDVHDMVDDEDIGAIATAPLTPLALRHGPGSGIHTDSVLTLLLIGSDWRVTVRLPSGRRTCPALIRNLLQYLSTYGVTYSTTTSGRGTLAQILLVQVVRYSTPGNVSHRCCYDAVGLRPDCPPVRIQSRMSCAHSGRRACAQYL